MTGTYAKADPGVRGIWNQFALRVTPRCSPDCNCSGSILAASRPVRRPGPPRPAVAWRAARPARPAGRGSSPADAMSLGVCPDLSRSGSAPPVEQVGHPVVERAAPQRHDAVGSLHRPSGAAFLHAPADHRPASSLDDTGSDGHAFRATVAVAHPVDVVAEVPDAFRDLLVAPGVPRQLPDRRRDPARLDEGFQPFAAPFLLRRVRFQPCFRAVSSTVRSAARFRAPVSLRKLPEILCRTLRGRSARSASLPGAGTAGSRASRSTPSRLSRIRRAGLWPRRRFRRRVHPNFLTSAFFACAFRSGRVGPGPGERPAARVEADAGVRVMTKSEGSRVHRHPDAADCPEGLPEDEAAAHPPPVRRHAGGHTRCWIEGGEVRRRDVAGDGTPEALPAAVPAEFGPLPPRLAAGPGVPDPDGGGRALRDASPGGGAAAPRLLCERLDATRPAPECAACGTPTARHSATPKSLPRAGWGGSRRSGRVSAAGPAAGDASRRTGRRGLRGTPSRRGRRASSPGPFRSWASRRRPASSGRRCWTAGRRNRACSSPPTAPASRCAGRRSRASRAGRPTAPRGPGKRSSRSSAPPRAGTPGPARRPGPGRRGGAVRRPGGLGLRGAARPGGAAAGAARRGRARRRLRRGGLDPERLRGALRGRELAPSGDRHEDVEACCRYFERNLGRMRHDGFRERGVRAGSGVVEGGCRRFGLRTERSGTRRAERGANAMLALKALVMNLRLPGFLEWQANQAVAA